MAVLKSVLELEEFWMMELVHDVDLVLNCGLVQGVGSVDELGYKHPACGLLHTAMDYSKGTTATSDNMKFYVQYFLISSLMGHFKLSTNL